jgi:hypothetical protein
MEEEEEEDDDNDNADDDDAKKCDKARQATEDNIRGSTSTACWVIFIFQGKNYNAKAPQLLSYEYICQYCSIFDLLLTINEKNQYKYRVIKNDCLGFNNLSYTIHMI